MERGKIYMEKKVQKEKDGGIERIRQTNIQHFEEELLENGSYEEWYAELEEFRQSLSKFYKYSIGGDAKDEKIKLALYASDISVCGYDEISAEDEEVLKRFLREFAIYGFGEKLYRVKANLPTESGDIIDWHIIGYLAPLEFKRIGWGGRYAKPSEQITRFAEYFKKRGKRFIYVALPCKGAIYPEIITNIALLKGKTNCIPQWRKMLKEIVEADVEVIDMLPEFQYCKSKERNLYLKDHRISPVGAKIVGERLGEYLRMTVDFENTMELEQEKYIYYEKATESRLQEDYTYIWRTFFYDEQRIKHPYIGTKENSRICMIGNCNLAAYWEEGGGILANTAYHCGFPIKNVGRYLPFGGTGDYVTADILEQCLEHDVIVYVGFPSDAFVRTSTLAFSRLAKGQWFSEWSSIALK